MKPAPKWIAFAPALFVVLWATGFVVARLSAGHVEPLTFLSIRFPIAGALFAAIALYQRATWPTGPTPFMRPLPEPCYMAAIWVRSIGPWRMACRQVFRRLSLGCSR